MPLIDRRGVLGLGLGAAGALSGIGTLAAQQVVTTFPAPYFGWHAPQDRPNPISFWNEVALQLVALDHSIDAADARAPGPCAAARALALAHIVMADAVAAAFPVDFEGYYVRGVKFPGTQYPDVFVGGAAAWILEHIYGTPAHTQLIGMQRLRFLKLYDQQALGAWSAGLTFARNEAFTSRWSQRTIRSATVGGRYVAAPGQHDVDPYNPDQKFYGVTWGHLPPLVPNLHLAALGPGDPPPEPEYLKDLEEVRELGRLHPNGPTPEQVRSGVFWAYDGSRLIGPPPRLYNQFVRQIAEADGMSVPELARLLALCNIAIADGSIVCWEAKYRYRIWRPVLGLPNLRFNPESGWAPFGSPRTNPSEFALGSDTQFRLTALSMLGGGERNTLRRGRQEALGYDRACFTPNFPSYPSGHATFGSACFNMLKKVRAERPATRPDPGRIDHAGEFVSDELNGVSIDNFRNEPRPFLPLRYRHIDQMIEDNNKSRVHLGVHWQFDCTRGAVSGARVADAVYAQAYRRAGSVLR
jgi:hypothetical protein